MVLKENYNVRLNIDVKGQVPFEAMEGHGLERNLSLRLNTTNTQNTMVTDSFTEIFLFGRMWWS